MCYCPGEYILVNSQVQNQTTRDMKALKAKLYQDILYLAEGHKQKRETKVIARIDGKHNRLSLPCLPKFWFILSSGRKVRKIRRLIRAGKMTVDD